MATFILAALAPIARAQNNTVSPPLPEAPKVADTNPGGAYQYLYRGQYACAAGASTSTIATKLSAMCGVGITVLPFVVTEFGLIGPLAHRNNFSAYMSFDADVPVTTSVHTRNKLRGDPIFIIGYTRMFEVGHAFDYGIGYQHPVDDSHSLQFELRDYMTFANPIQHNVMLRVVWVTGVPD